MPARSHDEQIALIGGSGFVGSAVRRKLGTLQRRCRVVDASPAPGSDAVDVRSIEALSTAIRGTDVVVNLAAVHRDDIRPKSLYDEVNVAGARNVCEAARRNNIAKIIFTSSVAVYGFAPPNTDETGERNYFNDYGRTKALAEDEFRRWQDEDAKRSLTIVRPTVIFGEGNRGNVYNLLRQIASERFVMVGSGNNVKSMAYVENVAAFLVHAMSFGPGVHIYNYIDKPDLSMNELIGVADSTLGRARKRNVRLPYWLGYVGGLAFDILAAVTGRTFPISSIRVRKFCSSTQFSSEKLKHTGFVPPVSMREALERTIRYEFLENHSADRTYETE